MDLRWTCQWVHRTWCQVNILRRSFIYLTICLAAAKIAIAILSCQHTQTAKKKTHPSSKFVRKLSLTVSDDESTEIWHCSTTTLCFMCNRTMNENCMHGNIAGCCSAIKLHIHTHTHSAQRPWCSGNVMRLYINCDCVRACARSLFLQMSIGYQNWATSPQQQGYGYGNSNAPNSYQGWGAPPQGPPPQWSNYNPQQTSTYFSPVFSFGFLCRRFVCLFDFCRVLCHLSNTVCPRSDKISTLLNVCLPNKSLAFMR